jgi:chondroitin AC lyase
VHGDHYTVQGSVGLETLRSLGVLGTSSGQLCTGLYRAEFSHRPDGSVHRGWMSWVDPGTVEPDFHVPSSFGVLELE